jgi:nucleoside-diphosphate-sugar epimerase
VLVTGGTGFVGRVLVRRLVADGYRVRVFARPRSNVDALSVGADVVRGDVADRDSFSAAMSGCDLVVHLAAGTSGTPEDSETATMQGTRNLVALCMEHRPARLVYVSSCSVYGTVGCQRGAIVTEESPLEASPDQRGVYSASKQRAETWVSDFMRSGKVPTVILRPGTVYGPGAALFTPLLGFAMGSRYIVIGPGGFRLPYVFVDNVVDAIVQSLQKNEASGHVFNVIDPEPLTKRDFMNKVVCRADTGARVVILPYAMLYAVTWLQELACRLLGRRPVLSCYRLASSQAPVVFDASKIAGVLGWTPRVSRDEALDRVVAFERSKQSALPYRVEQRRPVESTTGDRVG